MEERPLDEWTDYRLVVRHVLQPLENGTQERRTRLFLHGREPPGPVVTQEEKAALLGEVDATRKVSRIWSPREIAADFECWQIEVGDDARLSYAVQVLCALYRGARSLDAELVCESPRRYVMQQRELLTSEYKSAHKARQRREESSRQISQRYGKWCQ